jgi:hypothetical protein
MLRLARSAVNVYAERTCSAAGGLVVSLLTFRPPRLIVEGEITRCTADGMAPGGGETQAQFG